MCGRYFLTEEPKKIYSRYKIETKKNEKQLTFDRVYNISPGFLVPVITKNPQTKIEVMKWGLVPHWAKDPKIGYKLINTRSETINEKPSFKSSFQRRRCLIPATGFFEWRKTERGKVPYLLQLKSGALFSFAGIYDIWTDAEGKELKTFSIITTNANELITLVHDRMPVIFGNDKEEEIWLGQDSAPELLLNLLKPYPSELMSSYSISTAINDPKNQGEELLREVVY